MKKILLASLVLCLLSFTAHAKHGARFLLHNTFGGVIPSGVLDPLNHLAELIDTGKIEGSPEAKEAAWELLEFWNDISIRDVGDTNAQIAPIVRYLGRILEHGGLKLGAREQIDFSDLIEKMGWSIQKAALRVAQPTDAALSYETRPLRAYPFHIPPAELPRHGIYSPIPNRAQEGR